MTNEMSARLALHTSTFPTAWWNCRGMLNNPTDPRTPAHVSPFSPFGYPSEILITKCVELVIAPFQLTGTICDLVPAIHGWIDAEMPHYGQFRQIVRRFSPACSMCSGYIGVRSGCAARPRHGPEHPRLFPCG